MKTIFMGTPEYAMPSLEALFKESKIVGIFTGPDRVGGRGKKLITPKPKKFALTNNIPLFQPKSFKDDEIVKVIKALSPDLILVNAYGFILPKNILNIPKLSSINLHASLLPKYRGASPIQTSILNGEKKTGITAQIMSEKLDEGDIIYQINTKIVEQDDWNTLSYRLSLLSASCVRDVIKLYEESRIVRQPQNHVEATFCTKINKKDGYINWQKPWETISNKIKAYINWPQSFTYYDDKKIIIHKVEWKNDSLDHPPGTIITFDREHGILIQCGNGVIKILILQPQSKKPMDCLSFLNGYKWQVNKRLM